MIIIMKTIFTLLSIYHISDIGLQCFLCMVSSFLFSFLRMTNPSRRCSVTCRPYVTTGGGSGLPPSACLPSDPATSDSVVQ